MKTLVAALSIRRNPINAALERAYIVTNAPVVIPSPRAITKSLEAFDQKIQVITDQIRETNVLRRSLFGVEKQDRSRLGAQIYALKKSRETVVMKRGLCTKRHAEALQKRERLQGEADKKSERVSAYCKDYKRLDLEPLRWRNADGWPLLAIFSLSSSLFTLGAYAERRLLWPNGTSGVEIVGRTRIKLKCAPILPTPMAECFNDVLERLEDLAKKKKLTILLAAEFYGTIPLETKEEIRVAGRKFKEVFILAEARDWKLEEKKATILRPKPTRIVNDDPLVVGWDGEELWLVTSFNTTSLEKYIAQVHAGKQEQESKN